MKAAWPEVPSKTKMRRNTFRACEAPKHEYGPEHAPGSGAAELALDLQAVRGMTDSVPSRRARRA
jgi:hypothetical protein